MSDKNNLTLKKKYVKKYPTAGQPKKYATPEDLQKIFDKYFSETEFMKWTITGLALVAGSKQLIQDYEKRDGYREVVLRAKLRVENSYETSLRKSGRTGDIFALKNFGWRDDQHVFNNNKNLNLDISGMTDEEIEKFLKRYGNTSK